MNPKSTTRVDLHCHSTASEISKLGIQRSLGLPECATPPEEVYELAKRRDMDFVTITDHDTIDGCLEIADRDDVFISEELTVWFRGEPQAVHLLCFGITPDDHVRLQEHNNDVEACAEYLHSNEISCSLAHPFYAVEAPLSPAHRRRLAQLFPVWETRNGSRARELNMPAAIYTETHGGTGTGGSDDHAGVDIGRTFTETPPATTPEEFLRHIREGRADARGEQGSAAKWAHAAMGLATRALLIKDATSNGSAVPAEPSADAILEIAERVMSEGNVRRGEDGGEIGPEDARAVLIAFTDAVGVEPGRALIDHMQSEDFSHAELERKARRVHERRLREVVEFTVEAVGNGGSGDIAATAMNAGRQLFRAAIPAIPYAPAAAFLGKEKDKLNPSEGPKRVALIADAIGGVHGVTHTIERIRELGVPGYEVEVIGTDRNVDRRLSAVAEVEIPFYAGLEIGMPSLPAMVEALAEGHFDAVHVTRPWSRRGHGHPARPDHGASGAGQLAYRAGRLRRLAVSLGRAGEGGRHGALALLPPVRPRPLAEPGERRIPHAAGDRARSDRPLGPRRRHLALRPRPPRRRRIPGRDQGPICREADQGEGRRAAGRVLHPRPRAPIRGSTCCSAEVGRRRMTARAPRRPRDLPGLARG